MDIKAAIKQVCSSEHLSETQMIAVMRDIMQGNTTNAQNAAFLVGLQMKGVQVSEILGGARVMRELVTRVELSPSEHLVDTCGTGGSGSNKFNISTAAAIVAACAGAKVAKHGNRGASSISGSADVLEAAGVSLSLGPAQVAQTIEQVGVGFMFAAAHHSAMKHVITARKEIGVRTVFNLLGPLTNPASAPNQVMGVFDPVWIDPLLEVLASLGSKHVLIVCSEDGLDEISISAKTHVGELRDGKIRRYSVAPEDFGITTYDNFAMLQIASVEESLQMMKQALSYQHQAAGDIVAVNAGAAIYAANLSDDLISAVEIAKGLMHSSEPLDKLMQLSDFTQSFSA
ncbi:MAG: anthranilate phosphoribosyltransferase [SAR86 cluster bacterium]|uniref:Anthranilate phosphoribosyltransferase n=1 Tax=SAR86 cluster bacterium TaxID=2030880 RepID=A0A2A4MRB5_9GAMM|nr:MAG: anthranilate phosphoribosyltransferase [SAR86 cluster bacterium]